MAYRNKDNSFPAIATSKDGGQSWKDIIIGKATGNPAAIYLDPKNSENVFVAGNIRKSGRNVGVIYKSTDGGLNWREVYINELDNDQSISDQFQYGDPIRNIVNGQSGVVFLRTLPVSTVHYFVDICVNPKKPSEIYAAAGNGLFISEDFGDNWKKFRAGKFSKVCVSEEGEVFGLMDNSVIYLDNSGSEWRKINTIKSSNQYTDFIVDSENRKLILGSYGGIQTINY
ncbi:WD40/YVTN/BNR-like repeat-containing protein [candidate division KSB1 bacterium]